ncbi:MULTISPECIES: IS1182 family transposase [unclassified Phenylobacterium]|jgi:transposase|nr:MULTISPECIES: IS1182 family transposase [unclassified Phenylobacterium]MDP3593646.1 IS1182 family transposase [Phenylobacterium sp.]MDZ4322143.1 IS1182 family transposase [Phenylobacterium sp.]|tara:strand:- start:1195 stop:2646 length:1452 start_codon:yes stop_codon:yes gene_type:complete
MSYETAVRVLVSFLEGTDRTQVSLLPPCIDDYVAPESLVRVVDAFVGSLDLAELGFARTVAAATGRPGYHPGDMLRLYVWGYLNQVRSSRHLERACIRDLEALWLMKQLAPDYRTIAAFRHDNPEAIVAASAAFIQFCLDGGLITGRMVALDGTKMRAVASPKNIAGAERLARDVAHTEKEIAYYLDRLDAMDEAVTQGFDDQPVHRQAFTDAIAALSRRKDRLARRQEILVERAEKVLVFGEPDARPMGYAHSPKMPCYNMQSVVDVDSGLIVHHDVANEANDSQLLHPMSLATMEVLQVDRLTVLADGGYSNAQAIAACEHDRIEVAAPIKRGAMNTDFFRPTQFAFDEASDTIRCPAGQTMKPSGKHTRNRAIRYRTTACRDCRLKPRCTAGAQRTIHRLFDQAALDRMEARIYANPSLMVTRRCTVEHPFGTIKRMSGGGRFLTRGLRAVKAEAALSILAFNIIHAVNVFGPARLTPSA